MAVEELLRWVSPVKNMSRTVTTDVELRGQRLREGDEVMLFYPSAPGEALPLRPSNVVISGAMPVRFAPTPATA
ncbi:MAG TPA: hypothetical protein VFR26_09545 [Acidimicrobiales bacterium]|nr:hypothetical protein [Acidimicrobiales bacterium]